MSEVKVNSIKGVGASVPAISINNTDGSCTANITNNLSNRNLVINGAFQVAQRGTSSTGGGYATVDRFFVDYAGLDEVPEQAQVDVASGTTPYTLGFRKAWKIINGNQASGAGVADVLYIKHKIEGQNVAQSGWNYNSASSFIALSFWVKSSVAQTFKCHVSAPNGTAYIYHFETGSLTANTWTKITKIIPGNPNIQIDNNNNEGFAFVINAFAGTDFTASSANEDAWQVYSTGIFGGKDNTSTWYTTNDATLEITGVQLEVGNVATDFEHKSFAQELELCKRYYQVLVEGNPHYFGSTAYQYNGTLAITQFQLTTEMRIAPTLVQATGTNYYKYYINGTDFNLSGFTGLTNMHKRGGAFYVSVTTTQGTAGAFSGNNAAAKIHFAAEL